MTTQHLIRKIALATALVLPVAAIATVATPAAHAGVYIQVGIAPPLLPVYVQPAIPAPGYLWTPGYWAYNDDGGYYWVPGVWVQPPTIGLLWTPAWWGFEGGFYRFHEGYWGPHVGFYGGINYGFGYNGVGFFGGEWRGGAFFYNRSVANFGGVHVTNVYNRTVIVNNHTTVAYNGGPHGITARPTAQQTSYMHENHVAPTANQLSHQEVARNTPGQHFANNHGNPAVRAAASPQAFKDHPNERAANQSQRIANGQRTGQMTPGEAARADKTQAHIDNQVHNDRTANNGRLTPQEHQQVNREQNHASQQISRENHNAKTENPK